MAQVQLALGRSEPSLFGFGIQDEALMARFGSGNPHGGVVVAMFGFASAAHARLTVGCD
jgi:hypothetical protein